MVRRPDDPLDPPRRVAAGAGHVVILGAAPADTTPLTTSRATRLPRPSAGDSLWGDEPNLEPWPDDSGGDDAGAEDSAGDISVDADGEQRVVTVATVEGRHLARPSGPRAVHHRRRRRKRGLWLLVPVVVLVVVVAVGALQLTRPPPAPSVHLMNLASSTVVPGTAPALPWPAVGEAAVAVPGSGWLMASGPESPVPIASLTKIMTAYTILRDHPLAPTTQGPTVIATAADQVEAGDDTVQDATSVPVTAGEALSERQLLNGLMVHSANNFADMLARWDAGSVPAFVVKMNDTATALGMTDTHYVDANGLNPSSQSSAQDQLRLAMRAMSIPTFAAVVDQPTVTEPIAGVVTNFVQAIGTDGVVGVKSGFTQAAMGCLVLAAERVVDGRQVLVMAAVTGQPGVDPLQNASNSDLALIDATATGLHVVPVVSAGQEVAKVSMPWAPALHMAIEQSVAVVGWSGQVVHVALSHVTTRPNMHAGATAARLTVTEGTQHIVVPVAPTTAIPAASWRWRLMHG